MIWDRFTAPELGALDRNLPVVLPLAATEQHGPHLPLATDRLIAGHWVAELERRCPDTFLALPCLTVGCSAHHMGFPGTLNLSHEHFLGAILDTLESARAHGFRTFVLLNAHGGNQAIAQVALERFGAAHPDCRIALATWWRLAPQALAEVSESGPGGVGHACEFETSLLLHFRPELVRRDKIEPPANRPTFPWAECDMLRGAPVALHRSFSEMTGNGAFGSPAAATPDKGAALTAIVVEKLEALLRDLAAADDRGPASSA